MLPCSRILAPIAVLFLLAGIAGIRCSTAGDWPQILGPQRNGIAADERLADSWPADGPRLAWKREVGHGLAGVAVSAGKVILFHRVADEEVVEALDATDGRPLWRAAFEANYGGGVHADDGPRCVPTIHGDRVFVFGAAGDLHCVSIADGGKLWSRAVNEEFDVPEGYFGAGSSPLVVGDRVLLNVGGRPDAGLVAFSVKDGKTLWKGTAEAASYSSPTLATVTGATQAIFVTRYNVVAVTPETGKVLYKFPFGKRGPTVNAATPLVLDDLLFVSASYGVGAVAARLETNRATTVWQRDDVMSSQYVTCVYHEGFLYGVDGRQDVGVARLRCFDPKSGNVRWTEEGFGVASLILADDKVLALKVEGDLVMFRPTPQRYEQLAIARLFDTTAQPLPALADGRLYARDTTLLKCFELGR